MSSRHDAANLWPRTSITLNAHHTSQSNGDLCKTNNTDDTDDNRHSSLLVLCCLDGVHVVYAVLMVLEVCVDGADILVYGLKFE